jgi:hypothetical protein
VLAGSPACRSPRKVAKPQAVVLVYDRCHYKVSTVIHQYSSNTPSCLVIPPSSMQHALRAGLPGKSKKEGR